MTKSWVEQDEAPAGVSSPIFTTGRVAAILSLALHGVVALVAVARGFTVSPAPAHVVSPYPAVDPDVEIVVELPRATGAPDLVAKPVTTVVPPPEQTHASGDVVAHVDTLHPGAGGDPTVAAKARNLAPHIDDRTTVDEVQDAIDVEQDNRLKTAKKRASTIDLRMALEPMELTFVASGKGFRYARHPAAKSNASLGVAGAKGIALGGATLGGGDESRAGDGAATAPGASQLGSTELGSTQTSPAKGAAYGLTSVGVPQEVGASVAKARPHVAKGKPNVTADQNGTPQDTVDADQAVSYAMKSLVSTSTAGGNDVGTGSGGSGGGGTPGSGAKSGSGASALAAGTGSGPANAPTDYRKTQWFLDLRRRLGPLVNGTFPKEQEMELRNGTVIVQLVIAKNGSVVDVIVTRPSGFPEFDQNVVTRLRGASNLPPVPDVLSKGSFTVICDFTGGWRLQ